MLVKDVFNITLEEEQEGELLYHGWEYEAWGAFIFCNRHGKFFHLLTPQKIIKKAHHFYDFIFRLTVEDGIVKKARYIEKDVHLGYEDPCTDHIISSRASYRGMMYDHQYLLDDFNTFKDVFKWFGESILSVSESTNQRVKVQKNPKKRGDIMVPKLIHDRYVNEDGSQMTFFDTETKNYVHGFPLRIMPWYLEFEKTRLPKPAGTLKEFV